MLARVEKSVLHRRFGNEAGGVEHFLAIRAPEGLDFEGQVKNVRQAYEEAQRQLGLAPDTAVFRRVFLSDVLNQAALVRESPLLDDRTAVSIVQQPPLRGAKIEMLAYHIDSPTPLMKRRLSPRHLLIEKNNRRHLWSTRLCCCDGDMSISSEKQTEEIFDDLIHTLAKFGAPLARHCVRTWLYMKNVDIFYKGMVDRRRELFIKEGLTASTHYIASTGIEGACSHRYDIVSMDAYSHLDLLTGQMSYLNDFDYLNPTKDYNVTFERGTRIAYADRAHHYISGTASIDSAGEVVHPGNVMLQLDRTLKNIDALLRSGGAKLDDMMYLIVYLRDPADYARISAALDKRLPDIPAIIVQGAVCRPAWLIEIEGVAAVAHNDPSLPTF